MHRGDGVVEPEDLQPLIRTTVAGAGATNFPAANGGSALAANIDQATDVAAAPDGTVYVLSLATSGPASGGLRRVEPDGTIFEVADSQEIGLMILFGSITVDEQERLRLRPGSGRCRPGQDRARGPQRERYPDRGKRLDRDPHAR